MAANLSETPENSAKYFVSKPWPKFQTIVLNQVWVRAMLNVCVAGHIPSCRYGGGPAVSQLDVCEQCKTVLEELEKRRKFELETFKKLNSQYPASSDVDEFHISMSWFRRWELFVKGEEEDPPGPIDNNDILVTKGHVKVLRAGANLGHLSLEAWTFLHESYGGGPVYVLEAEPGEQDL